MTNDVFYNEGYALVVGVGADLPVTVKDARGIFEILTDASRCAYCKENVDLLVNEDANRSGILIGLDNLIKRAEENPNLTAVVFFSGHGGFMPDYHLVPYGYHPNDLLNTAIFGHEFTEKLSKIRAKKLLVLLDCCHAGGMAELKKLGFEKSPLPPSIVNTFNRGQGRVIIASSRQDELSRTGNPYSVFTNAIREGFAGYGSARNDGYSYIADIALYVSRVVPERTYGTQHPILDFSNADNFIVSYYAAGSKERKLLNMADNSLLLRMWEGNSEAYGEILQAYQRNLMVVETAMAQFIDQRNIPPDLLIGKQRIIDKINEIVNTHELNDPYPDTQETGGEND